MRRILLTLGLALIPTAQAQEEPPSPEQTLETVRQGTRDVQQSAAKLLQRDYANRIVEAETELPRPEEDLAQLVWIANPPRQRRIASELCFAIFDAFREHDIEIPFPQRDLHLRSAETLPVSTRNESPDD